MMLTMEENEWWKEEISAVKSLSDIEHIFRKLWPALFPKPYRKPLFGFPEVIIHAEETTVKKNKFYAEAKSGDEEAATLLVRDTLNQSSIASLKLFIGERKPVLISAHAIENHGVNAIPEAFAEMLAERLGLKAESGIVQINAVWHTGASGFGRLARQPFFAGAVTASQEYLLVDDFVGMGGTLANLRGYIEAEGGVVIGATTLTGKNYSAILSPDKQQLQKLRDKHGNELERWWLERFGHTFDSLTQSETRYLHNTKDADTIRDRIIAAEQEGNRRGRSEKAP